MKDRLITLAKEILITHSPSGDETEIDPLLERWFQGAAHEVTKDVFGNVIAVQRGKTRDNPLKIIAHKDEIAYVVKKIEADGKIRVANCGSIFPWKLGELPVDILARKGLVKGVLSMGSLHTSPGGHPVREFLEKRPVLLKDVYVNTMLSKAELEALGVYPGIRICLAREIKSPICFGDAIAGYHLDDKLGIAVMQCTMEMLHEPQKPLERDVYFIASSMEETGSQGAVFAARNIPGGCTVGLEIGPVAEEYDIHLNEKPIVWTGPGSTFHKGKTDALIDLAHEMGFGVQPACYWGAGSDPAKVHAAGLASEALCLAFPCENTHGYEMASVPGCLNTARLLAEAITRNLL